MERKTKNMPIKNEKRKRVIEHPKMNLSGIVNQVLDRDSIGETVFRALFERKNEPILCKEILTMCNFKNPEIFDDWIIHTKTIGFFVMSGYRIDVYNPNAVLQLDLESFPGLIDVLKKRYQNI